MPESQEDPWLWGGRVGRPSAQMSSRGWHDGKGVAPEEWRVSRQSHERQETTQKAIGMQRHHSAWPFSLLDPETAVTGKEPLQGNS